MKSIQIINHRGSRDIVSQIWQFFIKEDMSLSRQIKGDKACAKFEPLNCHIGALDERNKTAALKARIIC